MTWGLVPTPWRIRPCPPAVLGGVAWRFVAYHPRMSEETVRALVEFC